MNISRETIVHATEADWLEARRHDITSTECAGLFNVGVYENTRTTYELYHLKSGLLAPTPFETNERVRWGNRLEAAIAAGIAEDCGLIAEAFKVYMRIPELRMGSSFDFKITGIVEHFEGDETARDMFRKHGPGILEIKNVDGMQFKRAWIDDGEVIEAPPHIELQISHQFEVSDLNWGIIAPLVGGNTPKVVIRERDLAIGNAIRLAAAEFWNMVDHGTPPAPDFYKDGEVISRIYLNNDGTTIDLSDNERLAAVCAAYKAAGADAKVADERRKAAKAELLTIIGQAKSVTADGAKISAGTNKESYHCYDRAASERITISVRKIAPCSIESTVAPFRNVRVS